MIPVILFINHIYTIMAAVRCQTGPYLAEAGVSDLQKRFWTNKPFTPEGGWLHRISATILFWHTEEQSCARVGMIPIGGADDLVLGSSALLWPLFGSLCVSHFVETISCALQGRQPMAETGMTIFEHSLAFAEAEAVVRGSIGLGIFGLPRKNSPFAEQTSQLDSASLTRLLLSLHVPPEVLLIALISSCSHLSSHVLGIFNLQARCRLANTTVWGVCFMAAFCWSFVRFSIPVRAGEVGALRYPTVCIVGFLPHLMVIFGAIVCAHIYVLAIILTVMNTPPESAPKNILDKIKIAHDNLQANASLANIHISWHDDFYTTLLKIGFKVMTAASEAVYFNEGSHVVLHSQTWLERDRLQEIHKRREHPWTIPGALQGDMHLARGLSLVDNRPGQIVSGYTNERTATKPSNRAGKAATREEGVGATQRSGRWLTSWHLIMQITHVAGSFAAKVTIFCLEKLGVGAVPTWLLEMSRPTPQHTTKAPQETVSTSPRSLDFWALGSNGMLRGGRDLEVDVEFETRRRIQTNSSPEFRGEGDLDESLYNWWKIGGHWGEVDASGDYMPGPDDDMTSVISMSTNGDEDVDSEDDGQRTPTQTAFEGSLSENMLEYLPLLLDPRTLEHKQEARLLAQSLHKPGPMTRSQYRRKIEVDRIRLFDNRSRDRPFDPEDEERLLEQIILSRRAASEAPRSGTTWSAGGDGMGAEGPQCVVCHCSPRTILVWPCRCLSLCEECRVSLAMNNFGNCVCCRRDVVAFSRLYVP